MSGVLAVLDDLIADMGDLPGTTGHQVAQVRDAVAELIEAATALTRSSHPGYRLEVVEFNQLGVAFFDPARRNDVESCRAALARIEGAA